MPRDHTSNPTAAPLGLSVSRTFLDFIEPIWDEVSHEPAARDGLLTMGLLTWNAIVFADVAGDRELLDQIDARMPRGTGGPRLIVDLLLARKRESFAEHHWLVRDCGVFERDGETRLRVEAGEPPKPIRS